METIVKWIIKTMLVNAAVGLGMNVQHGVADPITKLVQQRLVGLTHTNHVLSQPVGQLPIIRVKMLLVEQLLVIIRRHLAKVIDGIV